MFYGVAASPQGKLDLAFVPVVNYALIDAIEVIERSLHRSLVEGTLAERQPAFLIEPLARRDVGDRNCAVIDPRGPFAAP